MGNIICRCVITIFSDKNTIVGYYYIDSVRHEMAAGMATTIIVVTSCLLCSYCHVLFGLEERITLQQNLQPFSAHDVKIKSVL